MMRPTPRGDWQRPRWGKPCRFGRSVKSSKATTPHDQPRTASLQRGLAVRVRDTGLITTAREDTQRADDAGVPRNR